MSKKGRKVDQESPKGTKIKSDYLVTMTTAFSCSIELEDEYIPANFPSSVFWKTFQYGTAGKSIPAPPHRFVSPSPDGI